MGLGDRLKGLREQAQQAVGEHRDQIQDAVHGLGEVANKRTHGKYADKISKFDAKATEAVVKFGGESGEEGTDTVAGSADGSVQTPTPAPAPRGEPPAFDE